MKLHNRSRRSVLADRALVSTTAPAPTDGLIHQAPPRPGEALVIWTNGRSVPSGEVRAVDVLFVGSEGQIVGYAPHVSPPRVVPTEAGARLVIELPAGTVERSGTQVGDYIEFS